jgi:protein-S-isoprenylcysteine O-methyltransferase Ste14
MQALELKVPPPIVALLLALTMWGASKVTTVLEMPALPRMVVAGTIAFLGCAISIAATIRFREARTTVNPMKPENASSLVTGGIYRFTRNPMYLALLMVLIGWAIFLASAWSLVGPFAFIIYTTRFQIEPEERALSAAFGVSYSDYKAEVHRWL